MAWTTVAGPGRSTAEWADGATGRALTHRSGVASPACGVVFIDAIHVKIRDRQVVDRPI